MKPDQSRHDDDADRRSGVLHRVARGLTGDYGMLLVLLMLGGYYSIATWKEQHPVGAAAARQIAPMILDASPNPRAAVLVVAGVGAENQAFTQTLANHLTQQGCDVIGPVNGQPSDARRAIEQAIADARPPAVIAATHSAAAWGVFDHLANAFPQLAQTRLIRPTPYHWPDFLKTDNLLNIGNQIAVIAILAIGMTMVIITAGIDLSVGSLIALSAVITAMLIRDVGGAEQASIVSMILCGAAGVAACAAAGAFNGVMVTICEIPAFIATLAMMLAASGLAYILADGQSINDVPDSFIWLGRGADLLGLPNAVVLMLLLYAAAHGVMIRTTLGRYIYAVGGNPEAARLSGVPVRRVLITVYAVSGALAGLGGVIMASQLKSGAPTYGMMYELYVIAAVVVGGASLMGGRGKVLGTLIGALIIAVIQNGMNLTGVESYKQKVVLGVVILAAVLIDSIKRKRWLL